MASSSWCNVIRTSQDPRCMTFTDSSSEFTNPLQLCTPRMCAEVQELINYAINQDIHYSSKPLDLRNQRVFAIKTGANPILDLARQTYSERKEDTVKLVEDLKGKSRSVLQLLVFSCNVRLDVQMNSASISNSNLIQYDSITSALSRLTLMMLTYLVFSSTSFAVKLSLNVRL